MDKELKEKIAPWLYDIWQEAKSSMPDNWDDVTYESLSERDKGEYHKSAQRLIDLIRSAGYVKLTEDQTLHIYDDDMPTDWLAGYKMSQKRMLTPHKECERTTVWGKVYCED